MDPMDPRNHRNHADAQDATKTQTKTTKTTKTQTQTQTQTTKPLQCGRPVEEMAVAIVEEMVSVESKSKKRKRHTEGSRMLNDFLMQQWSKVRKRGLRASQGKCVRCSKVGSQMLFRKPALEAAGTHCFDCNRDYANRHSFLLHMEVQHYLLRTQVCYQCYSKEEEACFLCSNAVSRRHDCPVMPFTKHCRCNTCGQLFKDKYALKRHTTAEHTVGHLATCSTCHSSYSSTSRTGCCKAKGKKDTGGYLACDQCSLTYQSVQGLRRHQRKKHQVKMAIYNKPYAKMCPVAAPSVDM